MKSIFHSLYQTLKGRHFFISSEIIALLELDDSNTFFKKLKQCHVYHCVVSPLPLVQTYLGTEETG